jgi:hypothetical protein
MTRRDYLWLAAEGWAMPSARALAFGQALLRGLVGSAASIAIAVFCVVYFAWQFAR